MSIRKKSFYPLILVLSLATFLSSCGGGGGQAPAGPSTKVSVITGVVSDGPVKNARVFLDINHNGIYDEGEPFSITNDRGEYRIEYILESGTDYLLIAEGSSALQTEDPIDNPADGSNLTFVMFVKMTSAGNRNSEPFSAAYGQDLNPWTFKNYLKQLDTSVGGIVDPDVKAILESSGTSQEIFKQTIKDKQAALNTTIQQVAGVFKSSNDQKDLESTMTELSMDRKAMLNFSDKNIADLSGSLAYQNKTIAKIGDMVISKPLEKATEDDVIITAMNTPENSQIVGLAVKPGTLSNYDVSVTPFLNILEIPEFAQIKAQNYSVLLGGDITALDFNGNKDYNQTLDTVAVIDLRGGLVIAAEPGVVEGFDYLYFDGSLWVNGGPFTSPMTIKTSPFVVVKQNSLIEKAVNIEGLSLLQNPVVVVKGYYAGDSAKTSVVLDAVFVSQPSDSVDMKIPENFIISEVVVVDTELSKLTTENKASVTIAVSDSDEISTVSTSVSEGKIKFILHQDLYLALKDGNQEQDFPGLGVYIDTRTVYRGIDMFLNLDFNSTVKQIINENVNRYLDPDTAPSFYSGNGDFEGVTINTADRVIKVTLDQVVGGEKIADITLTWSFDRNKVVRSYTRNYTSGDRKGSTYSSVYTYSTATKLTNVVFQESVNEIYVSTSGYSQRLTASYEGTAIYERDSTDSSLKRLVSAKFDQKHSEWNSLSKQTNTVNGLVTMEEINATEGKLTFTGHYSLFLPSYSIVSGAFTATGVTYAKGYSTQDSTYFNNNTLATAQVIFTSHRDYLDYTIKTNQSWIIGMWSGTFTDSCDEDNLSGQMSMSITAIEATWWGQSNDMSRNYGTSVEIYGEAVRLKDDGSIWSNGVKIDDTRIEGNWSSKGCQGSFILNKT